MRALLAFVIFWQVSLPASAAAAHGHGIERSQFVCSPAGGTLTPEAERLAHRMAELIGDVDQQEHSQSPGGCPLCVLAHGAPLPEIELPAQVASFVYRAETPKAAAVVVHAPRGPPVGAQGPPSLI